MPANKRERVGASVTGERQSIAHFGGPGEAPGYLRDLLAERIEAVPCGGSIDWISYYFRDRRLARALVAARKRGVAVNVIVEHSPRRAHANQAVAKILTGEQGLARGYRMIKHFALPTPVGSLRGAHLHEKLYCFSHPTPCAFIGSFNPSGDLPEDDPALIREIGDQDRGHNALVELRHPALMAPLLDHVRAVDSSGHSILERCSASANRVVVADDISVFFSPRVAQNPAVRLLNALVAGDDLRVASSHLKGRGARLFQRLARRGVQVTILAEDTHRRVPERVLSDLADAGASIRRIRDPNGLPMHQKFALVDHAGLRSLVFGSFNWTTRSLLLNHEIGAISTDEKLYAAFAERWQALALCAQAGEDAAIVS